MRAERHVAPDTFASKADAQAWLSAKETDINRGQWVDPSAGKVSFGAYATEWADLQRHLRPRTVELYKYLLRDYLLPAFGSQSLSAITVSQVAAWHHELAGIRPKMAPKAYRLLAQVMKAAASDGYIAKSPVAVKGAAGERVVKRPIPTVAEVDALAEAVPDRFKAMVLLASWCALRFGELAALTREQVDLLHGEVVVIESVAELASGERLVGRPRPRLVGERWPSLRTWSLSSSSPRHHRAQSECAALPGPMALTFAAATFTTGCGRRRYGQQRSDSGSTTFVMLGSRGPLLKARRSPS